MATNSENINNNNKTQSDSFLNRLINRLPFELHIPTYNFCGPGTKLHKRLARGDKGVNPLDEACREHDLAYATYKNLEDRHKADKKLEDFAWGRVKSPDARFGEKTAAYLITNIMKMKRKFGMGHLQPSTSSYIINRLTKKKIKQIENKKRGRGMITKKKQINKRKNVVKCKKIPIFEKLL
jgi:coat protein VP1